MRTLAVLHPRLSFIAQFGNTPPPTDSKALPESLASRIQCLRQPNPEKQPIRNATTYILFLQSLDTNDATVSRQLLNCIKAHADILRCNSDAKLVILAATSPAAEVDWHKHVADICRFQLSHGVPLDRLELRGILDEALRHIPGLCLAGMTVSDNGDFCIYEIASKGIA